MSDSETTTISREKWTVEDPPDGGVWAWIIVLACGVLHLCSELVYYIFYDTIVIGRFRNLRLVAYGLAPESTYEDFQVFEDVRLAGGTCNRYPIRKKVCEINTTPPPPHFYSKTGYAGVCLFFLFLLQNIDFVYSLETPRRVPTIYILRKKIFFFY